VKTYVSSQLFSARISAASPKPKTAWRRVSAGEAGFVEGWLQRAIEANPALVMAPYCAAEESEEVWHSWARELHTPAGPIDLLLVSDAGRVAVVETKLSFNPGNRRSVVAQVLDYAAHLPELGRSEFPAMPSDEFGRAVVALDTALESIEGGNFLLVIASDQLDERAVRLGSSLLGDHITRGWEMVLVDVAVYRREGAEDASDCLFVPHLRGVVKPVERQVVRVRLDGQKGVRIEHVPASNDEGTPRLVAAVAAFNAADPDLRATGRGKDYRPIHVPGWSNLLHYEFLDRYGRLAAELHLEDEVFRPVAEALQAHLPEFKKAVLGLEWEPKWYKKVGRLVVPLSDSAGQAAAAESMRTLIAATRPFVQSELSKRGLLEQD
jgi:hypothetical protein